MITVVIIEYRINLEIDPKSSITNLNKVLMGYH